ncbi:hypothetical protein HPB50_026667 [Hyalomma asiaticum]|uniref:Uncharacterized protein n=1 Tax=Hyalomma asiaticum TaxID=266040 RepID=A0ACB7RQK2_HYAAI|nr:hypothetical protein HPB50_026667 [Hyalomma asiaticum]
MTGEAYPHDVQLVLEPQSWRPSVDESYSSAPGEHDLGTRQAMVSFVLILVTVTVACVLIVMVTRYIKDYRAGMIIEAYRSRPTKTSSWPPLHH